MTAHFIYHQKPYDSEIYGEADRSQYSHAEVDMDDDDDVGRPAISERQHRMLNVYLYHWRIGALRKPVDEEQDIDMDSYRESHGSGLVNTRISDRENEVQYLMTLSLHHTVP